MSSNNEYQTEENDKGGHFLAMAMTSSKLLFSEEKDKKTDLLDEVKIQGGGIGCCDCDIKIFVARMYGSIEHFVTNYLEIYWTV